MLAFTSASDYLGGKFLNECTLYVTLEPCLMCAGASYWTRIGTLVFGASDPKRGYRSKANNALHPKTKLVGGIVENECTQILKDFFAHKRELK
jgi:tRNA(adenine34) deaminase